MDPFLWIDNQRSAQSKFIEEPFLRIIKNFDLIIEIGTFTGVFTKWISQNASSECRIFTYDNNPAYREVGDLPNVFFRIADFFSLDTLSEIKVLIQTSGRCLVLCDGGDKETEFKILSRFLKNQDVIMLHDYEHDPVDYESIKESIGWITDQESRLSNLKRYLDELDLIPYKYEEFKDVLWGSFTKKTEDSIGVSITTSKRLDLFKITIETLSKHCKDSHLIKTVLHFDDSSSHEDRLEMESTLRINFPSAKIYNFRFGPESISSKKRHIEIMKIWKDKVCDLCDYVFHTEDDWKFDTDFRISDIVSFMRSKSNVAYIGVSQELREFPDEIKPEIESDYWQWHFDKDKPLLENLFLDKRIMKKSGDPNFWCYYINWPYFGFRPGLWDTGKLSNFNWERNPDDSGMSEELWFAKNLSEKYMSYCLIQNTCEHIGISNSAYDINKSER